MRNSFVNANFVFFAACPIKKITNSSKNDETTSMLILNFTHKLVCAKLVLQHCGRQAQVQKLDAKFFGNANVLFFAALVHFTLDCFHQCLCVCVLFC